MPFRMLHAKIVAFVLDFNPETEGESVHREFAVNCPEGGALLPVGHTVLLTAPNSGHSLSAAGRQIRRSEGRYKQTAQVVVSETAE